MTIAAWKYYSRFYRGSFRTLSLCLVVSIGQSLIVLPIALLVRHVFDDLIPAGSFYRLTYTGIAIVLLYFINGGATLWTRRLILRTTKIVIQQFRDEILKKFYAFSRSYYREADEGKLHTIMVQDTERLDMMTNAFLVQLLPALFISITLSAVLIYLNWFLFLLIIGILPFLLFLNKVIGGKVSREVSAYHRSFETFSKGILGVLRMMDLTRIQSAEDFEVARQRKNFDDLRLTSGYMAWLTAAYVLTQSTTIAMCGITILIVGGKAISMGYMTLGGLLSFFAIVVLLKSYLQMISSSIPQIIEGNESLTTIYNLLETKDSRPYSGTTRISFTGSITLHGVHFRYSDRPILRGINLTIPQGTLVVLAGPNGAGKTTIANLILGFYRPQNGQLYADDHPFSELDMVDLRRHMGVVTQDPIIFPATIADNISYGHGDTRFEEIVRASKRATAHEFIQTLPQGYDTFVGENGLLLSGGQRQRIVLARALLSRPKLMILDEPTNHLDEATARKLMENLRTLDENPAILLITQDMNIMRKADYLYVLHSRGYIVASGHPATHLQNSVFAEVS